ncbi:Acly [Symbiodinium necroappetens]|uniref:Acly protein n=1 Tax=Symbiodinium necroappetens TaxID=1628268 RepID=A0A812LFR7_9DINO|nr:Acly [Symbiodinium necroappetens]
MEPAMSLRLAPPRGELPVARAHHAASVLRPLLEDIAHVRHDAAIRPSHAALTVAASAGARFRSKVRRCAAPALKRVVKENTKTKMATTNLWGVVICAPISKGRWWQFWKPVLIRMGLRTFSVQKFAEMLKEALPDILSPEKAQRAAGELVETALVGEIGRAVVFGDSRDKAYRCRDRLQAMLPDLEVLVEPLP